MGFNSTFKGLNRSASPRAKCEVFPTKQKMYLLNKDLLTEWALLLLLV